MYVRSKRDFLIAMLVCFAVELLTVSASTAADPQLRAGTAPTDDAGKALNLGFEKGTLEDWKAAGTAFNGQPIEGDTVAARGRGASQHAGKFWIGGYEKHQDEPQGTLTSVPFKVRQPWASFLVAGGPHPTTRVEIVSNKSGAVIFKTSGDESENLKPAAVDLHDYLGQEIFIRLVDESAGPWGHLNFDDFRFHEKKPEYSSRPSSADQFAHAGLAPLEAAKAMQAPPGFSVSLFAGEPDVQQPIAMAMDDRGRLWIAEAYSYPVRVADDKARDRILIFEDVDQDGRFDKRTVFIDNLNLVSGMEVGFGGVWVGAAPNLLFIADRDGDDKPDAAPRIVLDGWGSGDTHETLNSFIWGPDGWLYGCHGVFTHSRVGKPGTPDADRQPLNAGIWRYHPTQGMFEVFAHGTSNPWGVDFNDRGQSFLTACVIPHLWHVIQGARYQRQGGPHFNPYTFDDIKTIAKHRHYLGDNPHGGNGKSDEAGGGHAHAGAMIYLGGAWPDKYRDQIFMNNIHGARINQDQLARSGSGYVGDRAPDFLIANDAWSQILYLTYGPDGQVYMIDWYDKNQCHHGNTEGHDRTNGRIFKVSFDAARKGAKPGAPPLNLGKLTDNELVELQLDKNDWYVRHARRLLQERAATGKLDPAARPALVKMAESQAEDTRRLHALWALHATGGLDAELAGRMLQDASPYVRGWTVQLACEGREPADSLLARFVGLAQDDPSPIVRLYLASAAGRLPPAQGLAIASALVAHADDQADQNLPLMVWYAVESLAAADANNGFTLLQKARIPLVRDFLIRRMAHFDSGDVLDRLVQVTLGPDSDPGRHLGVLREIGLGLPGRKVDMPKSWPAVFAHLLKSPDAAVRSQAMTLASTFGDPQAIAAQRAELLDEKAPTPSRLAALATLIKVGAPDLAQSLQALLAEPTMRGSVLKALAGFEDPGTPAAIFKLYDKLSADEKRDALATLASRASYAKQLLSAVGNQLVPRGDVSADLIRQLRNLRDPDLEAQIVKSWGILRDTPADKARLISQYKSMLSASPANDNGPDLPLGRAVFVRTCQQCHTLFGVGGKIGPDLTGSNRANLDYVLSNIVDPSAQVGKDYQAHVITTTGGRVLTGLVRLADDKALTLVTANETIVIPKDEIDEEVVSPKSMMPDDLLKPLNEQEVRSLVAYLASPAQTPLRASADTAKLLFNDSDLTMWQGDTKLWRVEGGEIVGQTTGLNHNEFLKSELIAADFRVSVQVKLIKNEGNSGIQFRSQVLPDGEVKGYQADIGAGWWGKLYEEHGRGLLSDKSGEAHVKPGEWNDYVIEAVGNRIRTWINGQLCLELQDEPGAKSGCIALQLHAGGATEVRFKNFALKLRDMAQASSASQGPQH